MKTVAISNETHARLKKYLKSYGDTYDIVICRMLDGELK